MTVEWEPPPDRFLSIKEVCSRVGLGKSMVYRLIGEGRFPAQYKVTGAASRWSDREITAWIMEVKGGVEGKLRKFW
jgi:prophage regulatory protein